MSVGSQHYAIIFRPVLRAPVLILLHTLVRGIILPLHPLNQILRDCEWRRRQGFSGIPRIPLFLPSRGRYIYIYILSSSRLGRNEEY